MLWFAIAGLAKLLELRLQLLCHLALVGSVFAFELLGSVLDLLIIHLLKFDLSLSVGVVSFVVVFDLLQQGSLVLIGLELPHGLSVHVALADGVGIL